MAQPRKQYATASLKWEVELFPFISPYPSSEDFGSIGSFASSLVNQFSGAGQSGAQRIVTGIRNLSFQRAKATPESSCSFTIVGRPPKECIPGTWVIVSSFQNTDAGARAEANKVLAETQAFPNPGLNPNEQRKPRFIGQITTLKTVYQTDPATGLIKQQTVYHVREWSHCLTIPIRLDLWAFAQNDTIGLDQVSSFVKASAKDPETVDMTEIADLVKRSLNPFEMAQLILIVIGALQNNDKINTIDPKTLANFREVGVKMPSVPQSLLDRLGINAAPQNAFLEGFISAITGVQQSPVLNDGTWSGVFGAQGAMSLAEFKYKFNRSPSDRPAMMGGANILQVGLSAWQLFQSFCDPSINEVFTDFVHEAMPNGTISAKPVIFIRDKPFSMKLVEDTLLPAFDPDAKSKVASFSKYDNLPRVRIPEVNIVNFEFQNTILNSPNFIRANFGDFSTDPDMARAQSNMRPPVRLNDEINRFGGNELDIETNFLGYNDGSEIPITDIMSVAKKGVELFENPPTQSSILDMASSSVLDISEKFEFVRWSDKIKLISQSWNSYDYRMGDAVLTLKDDNFSISVGFNVQFKIGNFDLVGHVNSIQTSVNVTPNGTYITQTQLQLSRIVMSHEGQLRFIPPSSFCSLLEDLGEPSPLDSLGGLGIGTEDLSINPRGLA